MTGRGTGGPTLGTDAVHTGTASAGTGMGTGTASAGTGTGLDYVLPLRWEDDAGLDELTAYLRELARHARIIVVDGSPREPFDRHARRWRGLAAHLRPDGDLGFANGKVSGVVTGLRRATAEHVVIADDDVRYDAAGLARVRALLEEADLVRPQNHFDPLPWHARWDTARTLLNRGLGADYPGTFGVRRSTFVRMGGYDGNVLFENLELIRTVRAHGGREARPLDLHVRRLPPAAGRFWSQRVRQAYDDLAQPARMAFFLSVLPCLAAALLRRRHRAALAGAGLAVGLAEVGRRRGGGRRVFPFSASLFAPVWILERAVCSWLALAARLTRGGVPYAGRRLRVAAHPVRWIRKRGRTSRGSAHADQRGQTCGSGSPPARNPAVLCEPSQNGLTADSPHRHSATVALPGSTGRPS
ncbi:glycosyltransferase family 2 protein [Planomonospora sp. ID82291]|uniref:glycosyltransferase n=1 Tax=Planomonospora sp. ID82291 TaxID=2738136 RepID=UPI0027DE9818|nr:glycosyltransferase family 2 protein [Planomonospora sp. ID82291]